MFIGAITSNTGFEKIDDLIAYAAERATRLQRKHYIFGRRTGTGQWVYSLYTQPKPIQQWREGRYFD